MGRVANAWLRTGVLALTALFVFCGTEARAGALVYAASGEIGNTNTTEFGVLNVSTGTFSPIATLNNVFVADLVVANNGTIYASYGPFTAGSPQFGTINPTTGAINNIAAESGNLNSLAFNSNGSLYITSLTLMGNTVTAEALNTINPATGAVNFVANLSGPAANQIRFDGNTLYTTSYVTPSGLYTINTTTGNETLVGNTGLQANDQLGAFVNGQFLTIAQTGAQTYQLFSIDPATGNATPDASVAQFYVFALAPDVALSVSGGSTSTPVAIMSTQPVGQVTGSIGANGSEDYYSFYWAGGAFSATASISGANSGASYLLSEGSIGNCANGGSATLNNGDSFSGTISSSNLAAGQYCIGLDANSSSDPNFAITFADPLEAQTPEPGSFVMLGIGLGVIAVIARKTRVLQERSR